jgi:hypothetical protein
VIPTLARSGRRRSPTLYGFIPCTVCGRRVGVLCPAQACTVIAAAIEDYNEEYG